MWPTARPSTPAPGPGGRRQRLAGAPDERRRGIHGLDRLERTPRCRRPAVATAIGEDLRSEAPASAKLVRGAEEASELIAGWWAYRPAWISAPPTPGGEPGPARPRCTHAASTAPPLSSAPERRDTRADHHLLSVYGAEWMFSPPRRGRMARHELAAAEHGLELVRLRTNARDVLKGRIGWTACSARPLRRRLLSDLARSVLFGATQHPDHADREGAAWTSTPVEHGANGDPPGRRGARAARASVCRGLGRDLGQVPQGLLRG